MVRTRTLSPAAERPWMPRPRRRTGKAEVGAPVQRALPMSMITMAALRAAPRPKTSAICAQNGMNAAEVRLKAETIQLSWENSSKSPAIHGRALAILVETDKGQIYN